EALHWIDRTLEAAPRTGSRVKEADAFITVGMAYHDLGEPELAARYARLGAEKAENSNAIECACPGYFPLGRAAMAGRHLDEAGAEFQRAISFGRHVQAAGWESYLNRVVGHDAAAR